MSEQPQRELGPEADGSEDTSVERAFRHLTTEHITSQDPARKPRAWARLQRDFRHLPPPNNFRIARWLAFGAPALACAALIVAWLSLPADLNYTFVGGRTDAQGVLHTAETRGTVEFSDGSRVELAPDTALKVGVLGPHQAENVLRAGRLHVKVHHAESTQWSFSAGPIRVTVIGTEFDLGWKPKSGEFFVKVHEGRVRVTGPANEIRELGAGQSFESRPKPAASPTPEPEASSTANEPEEAAAATKPSVPTAPSWSALLSRGEFRRILNLAEQQGMEQVLATAPSSELRALAQAASYAGNSGLAMRAWQSVRTRFASSSSGSQAAFFLGRLYDQQGDKTQALTWFERYLGETGSGVYASEALGRKLTLVRSLRGKKAAQGVAKQYLERFPKGMYADLAKGLLNE